MATSLDHDSVRLFGHVERTLSTAIEDQFCMGNLISILRKINERTEIDAMQRVCVYPCYINSAKTGSQGRKLPVDKSVENPTTPEIYDVVQKVIKLPAEIEVSKIGVVVLWNGMECTGTGT